MALEMLLVIALSLLPLSELRGAIPYGILAGIHPFAVMATAVAANLLVVPLVFSFLDYVHHRLIPFGIYRRLFGAFVARTRRKVHPYVVKYGYLGLALFVSVPLPVTGAYTGTLAAWIFGMERKKSMAAISLGVVAAGVIITLVALTGVGMGVFTSRHLLN